MGRPYIDLVHPDDREATRAEVEKLAEGRVTRSFELRALRKDGTYRRILGKYGLASSGV